jgi:hypothetical protein
MPRLSPSRDSDISELVRDPYLAAVFVGVGVAAFGAAYLVYTERAALYVDRPEASGDVGSITVYAQRPEGPFRIQPGRTATLQRPQDLSFQWTVNGTGPREVRIELDTADKVTVMHEERLDAPADQFPLQFVLHVSDLMPDEAELVIVLEAPHSVGYESRYPLKITGTDKWELKPEDAGP